MLRANTSRQQTDENHWCLVQSYLPPLRYAVMPLVLDGDAAEGFLISMQG
ncbi:MAG TPA: hypothetical protein V6C57_08200 [Coleofasciculaceae cyanobacterium]